MFVNRGADQIDEHALDYIGAAGVGEEITGDSGRLDRRHALVLCDGVDLVLVKPAKGGAVFK